MATEASTCSGHSCLDSGSLDVFVNFVQREEVHEYISFGLPNNNIQPYMFHPRCRWKAQQMPFCGKQKIWLHEADL